MNSQDRVLNACERKGYDRIPVKHEGTPEINQEIKILISALGVLDFSFSILSTKVIVRPSKTMD